MRAIVLLALMASCKPGWQWEEFKPSTWLNDLKWVVISVVAIIVLGPVWGILRGLFEALKETFTRRSKP